MGSEDPLQNCQFKTLAQVIETSIYFITTSWCIIKKVGAYYNKVPQYCSSISAFLNFEVINILPTKVQLLL